MYNNYLENIKPEEILVYLRKSRTDDPALTVEEVLEKHMADLTEWMDRNLPYAIPRENWYKEIVSGESLSARVEFTKVLKLIESPNYKAIWVKEPSRLGRPDKMEIGYISKVLRYTSTLVITKMQTFDMTNDYERDMLERSLEQGNFYLEYQKRIMKDGRDRASKNGEWLSIAPYGYNKPILEDGRRKRSTLAINEEETNIVRMIFEWFVYENIGTQTISNRLNDMKVKPPKIDVWRPEAIRDILSNPVYIGYVRWNTRKGKYIVEDGEIRKTRPLNNDNDRIYERGLHDAIISEELFDLAQEKRGRTHRTCDNKQLRNPFASILYCECGRAMSYRHKKGREPRLVCNDQLHCGCGSCQVEELTDLVIPGLKQQIAEFDLEISNGNDKTVKLQEKLIKNLEKKLEDIDAKELSLWEAQVSPDLTNRMPNHIFKTITDKLVKEREDAQIALDKARKEVSKPIDYAKKKVSFQKALDALLDDEVSVDEKNHHLKACIERITYSRGIATKMQGKGVGKKWNYAPIEIDVKLNI
jgi:DNA invertase Pin-like site-specific DNA recombinase